MRTFPTLRSSARTSVVEPAPGLVWGVVASGLDRPQWYVDALPWLVRGGIDRLCGGAGRRWSPPGTPLLEAGDVAGFWRVREADATAHRLVLEADVRAPGRVTLTTTLHAVGDGTEVTQRVTLEPHGLLGATYLVVDLPAREVVIDLAHRRLLADLREQL